MRTRSVDANDVLGFGWLVDRVVSVRDALTSLTNTVSSIGFSAWAETTVAMTIKPITSATHGRAIRSLVIQSNILAGWREHDE